MGAIICSVTLQGVMFLLTVSSFVMVATGVGTYSLSPVAFSAVSVAQLVAMLCGVVSYGFLLAFLMRLNASLGNGKLVASAQLVIKLILGAVVIGFFAFLMGLVSVSAESLSGLAFVLVGLTVFLLAAAFAFAKFSNLVIYTAKAIEKMPSRPNFEIG